MKNFGMGLPGHRSHVGGTERFRKTKALKASVEENEAYLKRKYEQLDGIPPTLGMPGA